MAMQSEGPMKITEYFNETGVTVERDATDEEVSDFKLQAEALAKAKLQDEKNALAKEEARSAILEKLGLTAEEAKVLLG